MDVKALRMGLSKFATGITVITTADDNNNHYGVTVNSFTSVSLEPALVLWCLSDQTFALSTFLKSTNFAVNVLSSKQENISDNFAIPGNFDRFANLSYELGTANVPLIEGCLANFECSRYQVQRVGDHWVFICKIEKFNLNEGEPLIYYQSSYRS